MVLEKEELLTALNNNVRELQDSLDMHRCLVSSLMGHEIDSRNLNKLLEFCPAKTSEKRLREALKETIEVLDESRKSFKSKRLEALRKKLTNLLAETAQQADEF